MSYFKVNAKCTGCLACVENCPASALSYTNNRNSRTILHNLSACARCGNCWRICPEQAIEFQHLLEGVWDEVASFKLVKCMACRRPVGTENQIHMLKNDYGQPAEALCFFHRAAAISSSWCQPVKNVKKY